MSNWLAEKFSSGMKIFLLTVVLGLIPIAACRAGEEMVTRLYPVPPSFFVSGGEAGPVDPFAAPTESDTDKKIKFLSPKEIFERAGVTFDEGAYAWAFVGKGRRTTLVVHNTQDQHDLIEAYGCSLGPGQPLQITIIVEHIEVDAVWLSRWILDHRLDRDGTPLRRDVQGLVRKKKAKVTDTSIVTARSGQRGRAHSVRKILYPNAGDPPEVSGRVKLAGKGEAPTTSIGPTSFSERETGIVLEVDPVVGADSTTIDLNLAPLRSIQDGETRWPLDDSTPEFRHEKPKFFTERLTTQLVLTNGHYALLGTVDPLESELDGVSETKVLVFVRADVGRPLQGGAE